MSKQYNSRIQQKHDISTNWEKAVNFVPLQGEIIIYDDLNKMKIGDGSTNVNDLPFAHTDASNIAGIKAFVISACSEPVIEENGSAEAFFTLDATEGLAVNDIFSVKCKNSYPALGTITLVDTNLVRVLVASENADKLQNLAAENYENLTEKYFYVMEKPLIGTTAFDSCQYVEGANNKALLFASHAEGYNNIAGDRYSHAEGTGTRAYYAAHSEGQQTVASGSDSHAEGLKSIASGYVAHAEGHETIASGQHAHSEGRKTIASGNHSHAEGHVTNASGEASHAEGANTKALNSQSHAEGSWSEAQNTAAHAEGYWTIASGADAHSEGRETKASGAHSHAEGHKAVATGNSAHAEGKNTTASGVAAHAAGIWTTANADGQTVVGIANNTDKDALFIVGNGEYDANGITKKSNAFVVKKDGSVYVNGKNLEDIASEPAEGLIKTQELENGERAYIDIAKNDTNRASLIADDNGNVSIEPLQDIEGVELDGTGTPIKSEISGVNNFVKGRGNKIYFDDTHGGAAVIGDLNIVGHDNEGNLVNSSLSIATGSRNAISGVASFVAGRGNAVHGESSIAFGTDNTVIGNSNYSEGLNNTTSGGQNHTEGQINTNNGTISHIEGKNNIIHENTELSHVEGSNNTSYSNFSHIEGVNNAVKPGCDISHVEGKNNSAEGFCHHIEGYNNNTGNQSSFAHAEGMYTSIQEFSQAVHSEGIGTIAGGVGSHAEGYYTTATDIAAHAEGDNTSASGRYSHAEGGRESFTITLQGKKNTYIYYTYDVDSNIEAGDLLKLLENNILCRGAYITAIEYMVDDNGQPCIKIVLPGTLDAENDINQQVKVYKGGMSAGAFGHYSHSEGCGTRAQGKASHAEGIGTNAKQEASHAEGKNNTANGLGAHVEGYESAATNTGAHAEGKSTAQGQYSHAEGVWTLTEAEAAHAEGFNTIAQGQSSHAEGQGSKAFGEYSHAEGLNSSATGIASHAEGFSFAANRYAHAEGESQALGSHSHAEGHSTHAEGSASHAEGFASKALGNYSHAEGYGTEASGVNAHAEGRWTKALHNHSHASGIHTKTSAVNQTVIGHANKDAAEAIFVIGNGKYEGETIIEESNAFTVAFNGYTTVNGNLEAKLGVKAGKEVEDGFGNRLSDIATKANSAEQAINSYPFQKTEEGGLICHIPVEGVANDIPYAGPGAIAAGTGYYGGAPYASYCSIAMGNDDPYVYGTSAGAYSIAMGDDCYAPYGNSFAMGFGLQAQASQFVFGRNNLPNETDIFVLANGTSWSAEEGSNAFSVSRLEGNVTAMGQYQTTGADYAEYFEWADGNQENEDRVGYLVVLDGEHIHKANEGDKVFGITSATPAILGDTYDWYWRNKYLTDDFGRIQYHEVEVFHPKTGESRGFETQPILNPDYDPTQEYTPRSKRPEWSAVGFMGKLYLRDDGSCITGGYVKASDGGIATYTSEETNIRVLKRIKDNLIYVFIK